MRFREHRGSLRASMETVVELPDKAALVLRLKRIYEDEGYFRPFTADDVKVEPYASDDGKALRDERIGWDTYLVTIRDLPVGFTDGPAD